MRVRFTYHARSQALSRNINESRITDTLRNPDFAGPAAGDAMLYLKKFENGIIKVICKRKSKNEYLVLTVYFL